MKKLYILFIIASVGLFSGCEDTRGRDVSAEGTRFKVENSQYFTSTHALDYIAVITDKQTGVQYLVVNRGSSISVTPLLK